VTLARWARRHPLSSYYALTYGISWGGILIVLGASGFNLSVVSPLDTGLIFVSMLLGPSTAGLSLTALLDGRQGLRRLVSSLARWRAGAQWYALALLTMPLLLSAILSCLTVFIDPAYAPHFRWPLFAIGLVAGGFEEIGWTGFATPRLLARQRLPTAGIALGSTWALWHAPVDFCQNFSAMGSYWLLQFAIFYVATLTAYRLLMTWVYANAQSLSLAMLMHASYTGWLFVLYPATSSAQGLAWQSAMAAGLWAVVVVVMRKRWHVAAVASNYLRHRKSSAMQDAHYGP
jgi:membrane protease YdiL (CAAX protease family)